MSADINVRLDDRILAEIDRLSPQGDRSLFIAVAIQFYINETDKQSLRELIKEGAIVRAKRDLALAREWLSLDEEI
jgi:CopG family transcriptional regulator / antitoxin EndoAI